MLLYNDIMLLYNAIALKNGQVEYKLVGLVIIEKATVLKVKSTDRVVEE